MGEQTLAMAVFGGAGVRRGECPVTAVVGGSSCLRGIESRSDRTSGSAHPVGRRRHDVDARRTSRMLGWIGLRPTHDARLGLRVALYESDAIYRDDLPRRSALNAKEASACPPGANIGKKIVA